MGRMKPFSPHSHRYAELDSKILAAIMAGIRTFTAINARSGAANFRLTDRRLQALRKRGLIKFEKKEWSLI